MKKSLSLCFLLPLLLLFPSSLKLFSIEPTEFVFQQDPIDVVIPCTEKDKDTLNLCIAGIKKNGANIRRVMVVSKTSLTDRAEWLDESSFPFSKDDVAFELFGEQAKAAAYKANPNNRLGWIYQQLLKFYAPLVVKNISSNVLLLDSDTVFLNPVTFIGKNGAGYFNPGAEEYEPYFTHMKKLLPDLYKVHPTLSGISHHMLFQRCILLDLKETIETYHKKPLWKALLHCIDHKELFGSSMSEYEIYFNFALLRSKQLTIRKLRWENVSSLSCFDRYRSQGYHYVSAHAHMR
jgi:hypothetical protein